LIFEGFTEGNGDDGSDSLSFLRDEDKPSLFVQEESIAVAAAEENFTLFLTVLLPGTITLSEVGTGGGGGPNHFNR